MSQGSNISALFADLQVCGQKGDYERAIKLCNKILQEAPTDKKAFLCKIVSLIQLSRFDDALTAIHKNSSLAEGIVFEKAYCEYRLNRTKESLKTLRGVEDLDDNCKELLGQVLYRLEEYEECFEIYRDLVKNTHDDFEEERETNLSAVMAALQNWGSGDIEEYGLREDTYELCYNAACFLIGSEQYEEALEKLKKAEGLCLAMFEDDADVTQDEIDSELAVIKVQQGYCLQQLRKNSEANKLYNQVLKGRPSDLAVTAVASNNIVTINKDQNVFDSKKKMKAATGNQVNQKLVSKQREDIELNQCLLYMYTNQGEECRRVAQQLRKRYGGTSARPALIEAAQFCKEKQVDRARETLQEQIQKQPDSVSLKLTLAQLYLGQGQVYKACDTLKDLDEYTYKPGVVSALVTLYLSQEDQAAASDVLNSTIAWYQQHAPASDCLVGLIRANANFQLRHGDPQTATDMLEQLRKRNPGDVKTLAQLISAYSKFDAKKAHALSRELPSAERLAQDVDVDALEASVSVLGPRYIKKAAKTDASPNTPQSPKSGENFVEKKEKKKKKKKPRLPKNMDAEIDPERWLPLRERSYYRGKKKRGNKKENMKGTQGAVTQQQMAALDASAKSVTPSSSGTSVSSPRPGAAGEPATVASGEPAKKPQPQTTKSGGGKNKKKKKGGKW